MKINSRWFQLVASLIAMIMIANLQYAWTLFVKPMQAANGWKLSEIQWAFTLFILFQTWIQPLDGWLIDRVGPRAFISAAGVLCGLGWAGLGYATSLPLALRPLLSGGRRRGVRLQRLDRVGLEVVQGETRAGVGHHGRRIRRRHGAVHSDHPSIIQSRGYRTAFLWTGIFQGLVILIVAQFLRHPPAEPATAAPKGGASLGRHQFTTLEMLRTPQFYTMYAMFVLMATGGLLVTANAGPMAQSWGLSAGALTLAASLSPIANGASRVSWGWISDWIGRETAMVIAFILQAICLVLVVQLGHISGGLFALTLVLVYFTWGEIYSLFPPTTADYFGTRHATSNYAVLYTAKGMASIIGGGVGALLFERFGTWSVGFYGSAVMALVAAGLAYGMRSSRSQQVAALGVPATAK